MAKGQLEDMAERLEKVEKELQDLKAEKVQFIPIPYQQPYIPYQPPYFPKQYPYPQWEPYRITWCTTSDGLNSCTTSQGELSNG